MGPDWSHWTIWIVLSMFFIVSVSMFSLRIAVLNSCCEVGSCSQKVQGTNKEDGTILLVPGTMKLKMIL